MKNSGSYSAPGPQQSPDKPPRKSFALSGPTVSLDPKYNAVRPDLADLRLAEYVFAPHYAAPIAMIVHEAAAMRDAAGEAGTIVATLAAGTGFDMLDVSGGYAWGVCEASGLVGYVARAALGPATLAK